MGQVWVGLAHLHVGQTDQPPAADEDESIPGRHLQSVEGGVNVERLELSPQSAVIEWEQRQEDDEQLCR